MKSILINTTRHSTIWVTGRRWSEEWSLFKRGRSKSLGRERDELVSHILLHEGYVPEARLTVTWVDVTPGTGQRPHPPRTRAGLRGRPGPGQDAGRRRGADAGRGGPGLHPAGCGAKGVKNASEEVLTYVSAATPTVDWRAFYDEGPLGPRSREKEGA